MSRIKPAFGRNGEETGGSASERPGRRAAAGEAGSRTLLHLTLETEEPDVLDRIRAALPAGCRLEVRVGHRAEHVDVNFGPSQAGRPEMSGFTGRQREVLALLLEGLSNKEIGRRLALSHFTVRNHVSQSLRLLNVSSRKAAIERLAGAVCNGPKASPSHGEDHRPAQQCADFPMTRDTHA